MKIDNIGMIIANRDLVLADGKEVIVKIGKPEKFPDSEDYYCPYQIIGIGNERVRYAGGIDSIQALLLALKMIGTDLYMSNEAKTGILSWKGGEKGNLGFPVPDTLRDLVPNLKE
jgi:Domain of unknown function (DUF6968)